MQRGIFPRLDGRVLGVFRPFLRLRRRLCGLPGAGSGVRGGQCGLFRVRCRVPRALFRRGSRRPGLCGARGCGLCRGVRRRRRFRGRQHGFHVVRNGRYIRAVVRHCADVGDILRHRGHGEHAPGDYGHLRNVLRHCSNRNDGPGHRIDRVHVRHEIGGRLQHDVQQRNVDVELLLQFPFSRSEVVRFRIVGGLHVLRPARNLGQFRQENNFLRHFLIRIHGYIRRHVYTIP